MIYLILNTLLTTSAINITKDGVGIGTTPNDWNIGTSGRTPIQIGYGSFSGRLNDMNTEITNNAYATGTGNVLIGPADSSNPVNDATYSPLNAGGDRQLVIGSGTEFWIRGDQNLKNLSFLFY